MERHALRIAACGIGLALSCMLPGQTGELGTRVVGRRYELKSQGSGTEAKELLAVLEAAWPAFADFVGKAPKVSASNRLRVHFYADQEQWRAGLDLAGATYSGPAGGNYCYKTQSVYFFRQPTTWFTRKLMLQMCAHQFLAHVGGHKKPASHWFRIGAVNYLCNHAWDGERIQIGVPPALTLENQAALVAARLREPGFDYRNLLDPTDRDDSAIHCEAMRLIQSEPPYRRALFSLRPQLDRGVSISTAQWNAAFGSYERFEDKLRASALRSQEPFAPVLNQWETRRVETDEKTGELTWTIRGDSPQHRSAAAAREDVSALSFRVDRRGQAGRVGVLLDWISLEDHRLLLFAADGSYLVQQRTPAGWEQLMAGALDLGPGGFKSHDFRVECTTAADGELAAAVQFDGKPLLATPVRNRRFGFALDSGVFDFEQVRLER